MIRKIKPEDDKILGALIRRALEEFKVDKPGTIYFEESTNHLSDIFTVDNCAYYVVEVDGEIAGGCGFYPTDGLPEHTVELVKMYLSDTYRRNGFGQKLLDKCMMEARISGNNRMYIETMHELTFAISMYKKNGFVHLDKPLGNTGHHGCDIWMARSLN